MKIKNIGKKLTLIVSLLLVVSITIVVAATVILSKNHSDKLMQDKSASSLAILKNEISNEGNRLGDIYSYIESSGIAGNTLLTKNETDIATAWETHKGRANDFAVLAKKDGTIVWSSDNYALTDTDFTSLSDTTINIGIVKDSGAGLTLQYITPVIMYDTVVGFSIIGMNLTETEYLDQLKELTGAEVTLFNGTTRYSTTVQNADGTRAVGTEMSDAVASKVIENGQPYHGTADILGNNHFVDYEPMYDINENIVGAYFAGYPSVEENRSFLMMMIIAIAIAVVATVATGIALSIIIRKSITKPISIAEELAGNMSSGNLDVPDSDYNFADDEIGRFVLDLEKTKHDLSSYIGDISRILACMAEGDFSQTPDVEYIGDFETVKISFQRINTTLSEIINNMNSSADDVMTGSNQIADGAQMLAEGTTKQATAIDELSSTIDNISNKVQSTAGNAEQANKLSVESFGKISQQNEEISTMLEAMEEIRSKSEQISDIINTIDDIAFQTNILALNAAIEAARAGEAGKGFAVVADEVRNLAAKSAEAASHTSVLISATVNAVNNGVQIAENTAETMKVVMEYSEKTDQLVGDIYTAAAEQAEAIRQVTIGIGQISEVVQQNSATAEQTAASCEELSGQSRLLKEQVDQLKA